jgi:putative ATPase
MRPRNLDELVGQEHALGQDTPLGRALRRGELPPLVLWGPAGTGKTTLARLLAQQHRATFRSLHATAASAAELRKHLEDGRQYRRHGQRLILFVDELHRLTRVQQDLLLPYLEEGSLVLIGATTENPYFDLAQALRSRVRLVPFRPLGDEALSVLLRRALTEERGLGGQRLVLTSAAEAELIRLSEGDGRRLLNLLEDLARGKAEGATLDLDDLRQATFGRLYDHREEHYATISAFIKSVRGGDPDAALVWLAKMLRGGENPRFIARRLVILASEDVGLADKAALPLAEAAAQAVEHVGMPEAAIILSHAALYLALAPKSRAVVDALHRAQGFAAEHGRLPVPGHLLNAPRDMARDLGYEPYRLPEEGGEGQSYWPEGLPRRPIFVRPPRADV